MAFLCAAMRQRLLFLLLLAAAAPLRAQLVNIETRRLATDSVRWALKNDCTFRFNDTDGTRVFQVSEALTTQAKSRSLKDIVLLLGQYQLIRSRTPDAGGTDLTNILFGHLRYNRQLAEVWRLEAFVQAQRNPLLDISARYLAGGGMRVKALSTEPLRAYLGLGAFWESEYAAAFDATERHARGNAYLGLSGGGEGSPVTGTATVYAQPDLADPSDWRLLADARLDVDVTEHLGLVLALQHYRDTRTPSGGLQYTTAASVGFSLDF
jgi:hypothetical protein